ncbi:Radical SAM domain protein [Desulfarculus baarsii DSM 2075]|uniref:Radical SAM domain protein n=1 Tax=Desulfarculus baarsii (strain ATCC 33931 / DSM 2075 / LMG 7858 / VKM B-1802 / 2st14) TaxID=644282 RepID=E1QLF5_DESB2|nr:radical SAM protein [Desulfarculus baarsii]ADK86390.1 Radical SAM domain protein [Desulfarculus baarsii DSM 2075]
MSQAAGAELGLFVPGMIVYDGRRGRFPALSLGGGACRLMCPHCQGRMLAGMTAANDPRALVDQAKAAKAAGAPGLLISGGCDQNGRLPWERFAGALARIKDETGLYLAVHAGFADEGQARLLAASGVDLAMIDLIGDDAVARRIYGLSGVDRVEQSLQALAGAGLNLAPHVVVGLDHGRLAGEERAVAMAVASGARVLVLLALRPLAGTPMAGVSPPPPAAVARLIGLARGLAPELVINLGCGRPRGPHAAELERLAILAGVDNIAAPSLATARLALELGRRPVWRDICCAASPSLCVGAPGERPWPAT